MRTRFDFSLEQIDRFYSKVAEPDSNGCHRWGGTVLKRMDAGPGYGYFKANRKMHLAHRVAYFLDRGDIPVGKVLDHLCRVRTCCNPEHLDPVTQAENMARGARAMQTHCKRGHEFSPENTYEYRGSRLCRTCQKARMAAWKHKQLVGGKP